MISFEDFCRLFDETLDKTGFVVVKKEENKKPDETKDESPAQLNMNANKTNSCKPCKPLPCPFCGEKAELKTSWKTRTGFSEISTPRKGYYVSCSSCGCIMPYSFSENDAIKAWNSRVSTTAPTEKQQLETTYLKNIAGYGKVIVDFAEACEKLVQKD